MESKPDLATVLEHYGVRIMHRHGWIPCKCIMHDDSHASAAYNLDSQGYNCLVCQILGDVYDVVARMENLKEFRDVKRRAEELAHGSSRALFTQSNTTGSVLPRRAGHHKGSGGSVPSWKRRGA